MLAITNRLCRNVRALSELPFHLALLEISATINNGINRKNSTKRDALVVNSKKKLLLAWPSGVASKGTVHCNKLIRPSAFTMRTSRRTWWRGEGEHARTPCAF